jgi:peptidyl-prolyl cis-trans isomerase NIMA-interacting 1
MLRALILAGLFSALAVSTGACVVTTYEGAGDPPRVPAPPERASAAAAANPKEEGDDESFAESPGKTEDRVGARHLLVQYKGALRAGPQIVRTREEARKRAEEALVRARAGEDFAALVKEYSDEPGAGERGGDLGRFDRHQMVKAFSDAAFGLEIKQISDVVETPFGFHVIQRTE